MGAITCLALTDTVTSDALCLTWAHNFNAFFVDASMSLLSHLTTKFLRFENVSVAEARCTTHKGQRPGRDVSSKSYKETAQGGIRCTEDQAQEV